MRVYEDPTTLNFFQWIRRGLNLPFREIFNRAKNFCTSLPHNALKIIRYRYKAFTDDKIIHFIILTDRLGDILAAEPSLECIKKPNDYIIWLPRPRFVELLKFNPLVDAVVPVSSYTETLILRHLFPKARWTNLQIDGALCNIFGIRVNNAVHSDINVNNYYDHGSLADVYSLIGIGKPASRRPMLYPDPDFDPAAFLAKIFLAPTKPLLIFHPVSDEAARSWLPEKAKATANWLIQNTDFNIIEVGLTPFLESSSRISLLRGTLPLSQQITLFPKAKIFIGVDSGFAHVANAARTPSILLIGAYRHFQNHLPWKLGETDIVIRATGQVNEISVPDVIGALEQLIAKTKVAG